MFVFFVNNSLVINLIEKKQLTLLYFLSGISCGDNQLQDNYNTRFKV